MNIRIVSLSLLLLASGAMAAGNEASPAAAAPDIQKIVSMTPVPGSCQVEPATMVYLDSQGVRHSVTYQVMGTCQGGV